MNTRAFITGSRVYGTPGPDSDIDLVVRADEETIKQLVAVLGRHFADYDGRSVSIQVGGLNLHLCHDDKGFALWRCGTAVLKEVAPVEREAACRAFTVLGIDRGRAPRDPEPPPEPPAVLDAETVT